MLCLQTCKNLPGSNVINLDLLKKPSPKKNLKRPLRKAENIKSPEKQKQL